MAKLKKENEVLKTKCEKLEEQIDNNGKERDRAAVSESKLEEIKNTWKKEHEEEKVSLAEVIKKQIQEKTQDAVLKVIKEKEDVVRDTVERNRYMVIFGLNEKKTQLSLQEKERRRSWRRKLSKWYRKRDRDWKEKWN